MSFYGGIKRIDDTVFKFDKIYRTRKDMDDNAQHDGVYIGRYVLVEYGERYHGVEIEQEDAEQEAYEQIENSGSNDPEENPYPLTQEEKEKLLIKGIDFTLTKDVAPLQDKKYYKLKSDGKTIDLSSELIGNGSNYFEQDKDYYEMLSYRDDFNFAFYKDHRLKDQSEYKDTFDSTVWVKIFNGSIEKYIMIAELNAMIPALELTNISPLTYEVDDTNIDSIYGIQGNQEKEIIKTKEIINQPSISPIQDTELTYNIQMPKPLELQISNENISFNQEGFDIAYHPSTVVDLSTEIDNTYIRWEPIFNNDTVISSVGDNKYQLTQKANVDAKALKMNVPIFGSVISDLYDLLYGKPKENEGENPDFIRPFFKEYRDEAGDYNGNPRRYGNDDESWLANIPKIGDILKNNTTGLAGILSHLFAIRNPYTGTVTFYLRTDWNALLDDSSDPCISGKPYVITRNVKDNENPEDYPGDYKINYTGWNLELC